MFKIDLAKGFLSAAVIFLGTFAAKTFTSRFAARYNKEIKKKESFYKTHCDRFDRVESERENLDKEVMGIGRLYDISKKMSQSLRFEDIISALAQFLKEHFSYSKIELLLLNDSKDAGAGIRPSIKIAYEVDSKGKVEKITHEKLETCNGLIEAAHGHKKAFFASAATSVVPLIVEHKIIAILVAADLKKEAFDNFLLLASQFSLQIKKVILYENVQALSITDGLTGTYRRRYFEDRLKEELERSKRLKLECSLLIVDIDHFKNTNDTFGHLVGDVALKEMAGVIRKNIREVDLLARFGGEEFSVILPETGSSGAMHVGDRIREAIAGHQIRAYDEVLNLAVSIGVASYPKNSADAENLVDKADQAMYKAKNAGRNRVVSWEK